MGSHGAVVSTQVLQCQGWEIVDQIEHHGLAGRHHGVPRAAELQLQAEAYCPVSSGPVTVCPGPGPDSSGADSYFPGPRF